ncbi:MAG: pseudaminic acid cytidylyltransferase [Lachnospiraceae bacterium]|nr:pseudaminic acid cytidylyltransferase [Lachnospiraceae bacterium]
MSTKKIAIITARGGSKRIPRKNIKDFCGKPIIAYSIEAALQSGIFEEVMVSTDDEEIAEIAKSYGAAVPFMRSERTSGDYATTADVIMEVLEEYRKRGVVFEYACCIYPTAPFVTPKKLQDAMALMEQHKPMKVIPVVPFSFPPQRCFVIENEINMRYRYPEYATMRSQDLEKHYHDAGQFYVYYLEKYLEKQGRTMDDIMPIVVSELEVQDIDTEDDWKIAELKYKLMHEGKM